MLRRAILVLLSIAAVACSNPRVAVTLDDTAIRNLENESIFPGPTNDVAHVRRQVIQFRISSRADIYKDFGQRQIQTRCFVDGSANGKEYRSFGVGPRLERVDHGSTPGSKEDRYRYLVYSFVDLQANDVEYKDGKPATTLDLKGDRFQSLRCHIVGVEMAPVFFPRSNDFGISAQAFHDLLHRNELP